MMCWEVAHLSGTELNACRDFTLRPDRGQVFLIPDPFQAEDLIPSG